MEDINPEELWFNTITTASLCRAGGNGPNHPSQLYALEKYAEPYETILDYGCGSATTLEALLNHKYLLLQYTGVDVIPKNIAWCQENFKGFRFHVNKDLHKINESDRSFDIVYSRHVVDHMNSFEAAMDEHCRVAKRLVVVVLWTTFVESDEHQIKNIVDQRGLPTEKTYPNEYTNNFSRKKVMEYLNNLKDFSLVELTENVGSEVRGHDTVIVLKRKEVSDES